MLSWVSPFNDNITAHKVVDFFFFFFGRDRSGPAEPPVRNFDCGGQKFTSGRLVVTNAFFSLSREKRSVDFAN